MVLEEAGDNLKLEAGLKKVSEEACDELLANGFHYVTGCPLYDKVEKIFQDIPSRDYDAYRKLLVSTGLSSYQTHSRLTLWPLTQSIMQATIKAVMSELDLVAAYGCRVYTIHPPVIEFLSPLNKELYFHAARFLLQPICEYACQKGMRVALETTTTIDNMLRVLSAVNHPDLGICLDTGMSYVQEDAALDAEVRRLGEKLYATHINDEEGVYFKHEHLFPGEGGIDWNALKQAFLDIQYNHPFFFELSAPLSKIRQFWNLLFRGLFVPQPRPEYERYYYGRNFPEAELAYKNLFQREKDVRLRIEYGLKLAMVLFKIKKYQESIEVCERIQKECSEASGVFAFEMAGCHVGKCLEMQGNYQAAAEIYLKYQGNDPIVSMFAGPYKAAQCYFNLKQYDRVIAACEKIFEKDATYCYGLLIALACYELKGEQSRAKKMLALIKEGIASGKSYYQYIEPNVHFLNIF